MGSPGGTGKPEYGDKGLTAEETAGREGELRGGLVRERPHPLPGGGQAQCQGRLLLHHTGPPLASVLRFLLFLSPVCFLPEPRARDQPCPAPLVFPGAEVLGLRHEENSVMAPGRVVPTVLMLPVQRHHP